MSGIATKSYVSYVILGGLVAVIGLFLYYRNSSRVQTTAPTTTAPTTTAPTTTAPATTAPTTVAPTLAPYVPWYSPPQIPEELQKLKSNILDETRPDVRGDLEIKKILLIASLIELNQKISNKQIEELFIELIKRKKTEEEINVQLSLIYEKATVWKNQLEKY